MGSLKVVLLVTELEVSTEVFAKNALVFVLGVFAVIKLRMIDKCHCHFTIIFVVLNVRNRTLPYFSSSTILEAINIERFRAQINLNVLQNHCCLEAPLELISVVALQCHHTSSHTTSFIHCWCCWFRGVVI